MSEIEEKKIILINYIFAWGRWWKYKLISWENTRSRELIKGNETACEHLIYNIG